jgi:hypothetical protein
MIKIAVIRAIFVVSEPKGVSGVGYFCGNPGRRGGNVLDQRKTYKISLTDRVAVTRPPE